MLKKIPIRVRLTIMTIALLTVCCVGLTIILNFSADKMAVSIKATALRPAQDINSNIVIENTVQENSIPNYPLSTAQTTFKSESILYMILVIAIGGILTYYISGKALRPLNQLNTKVKDININNLSNKIQIPSAKDEIAELTQSFNEMTDKLHKAFVMQQNFSANAAHELKTPLSVLQTKVDVFKKKNIHTSKDYDDLIHIFEKQIIRLRELVTNLLNMTNSNDSDEKSNIYICDIFNDIILEFESIASSKNINMILECDDSTVLCNTDLLYRTLYNIVENAIKYNTNDGTVNIIVNKIDNEKVSIKIKDTGIGIPDDIKNDIFEPFFRVDESRSRQVGGAGLGLSIVKNNLNKLNGTIIVTNNENVGTCFEIILNSHDKYEH